MSVLSTKAIFFPFRYLLRKYDFISKRKVGIWGWSYGGYLSARVLVEDEDEIFKCTASVAPVTKWELYGKYAVVASTRFNDSKTDH